MTRYDFNSCMWRCLAVHPTNLWFARAIWGTYRETKEHVFTKCIKMLVYLCSVRLGKIGWNRMDSKYWWLMMIDQYKSPVDRRSPKKKWQVEFKNANPSYLINLYESTSTQAGCSYAPKRPLQICWPLQSSRPLSSASVRINFLASPLGLTERCTWSSLRTYWCPVMPSDAQWCPVMYCIGVSAIFTQVQLKILPAFMLHRQTL